MNTKVNFQANYQEAEKKYNLGKGEYFKVAEGQNKIRLISECLPHESFYKGQRTFKWLSQIIDRKDGKVKPYFMPTTIYKQIEALQLSEDYKFDEVPMPYDITIIAKGAGTKEVEYSVQPARNNSPLTDEDTKAIADAPSVQELQKKIKDNETEKAEHSNIPHSTPEMTDEEISKIPF